MQDMTPDFNPVARIKVIGVGGGGGNSIDRMIHSHIQGVDFIAVNTDAQALGNNSASEKLNIGRNSTKGLGSGANPDVGKKAAEESIEEIKEALEDTDMVFITAGLGKGTGSGAAPIVAQAAKEMGVLTVGVVTKPFSFEGARRRDIAEESMKNLSENVDAIITIQNDKILSIVDKRTPMTDAYMVVDDVLRQGVQGISDLITQHGMMNVDFADVRTIMTNAGDTVMGVGHGSSDNRAVEAARAAIDSPLLELSIAGAKGVIINITGGSDLSMFEVEEASKIITESADPDSNIIVGAVIDDNYSGEIKVTVIATNFDEESARRAQKAQSQGQQTQTSPFARQSLGGNQPAFSRNPSSGGSQASGSSNYFGGQGGGVSGSSQQTAGQNPSQDDLETPAFMRTKIK